MLLKLFLVSGMHTYLWEIVYQLLLVTGLNRQLGISDEWFAMGDTLVLAVLSQVTPLAFITLMVVVHHF